jgi:hypothetical protein
VTEIAVYRTPQERGYEGLVTLRETAQALSDAHRMASALVKTAFVPAQFRGKPEEAAAAMLAGAEVGLSPLASLRAFDIINGTAAPRAIALRAVAQAHGHEVWVEESTEHRAVVCGRRRGSQQVEQVTWTMDRARRAGLAGKSTWQQHPEAMLVARATAEVVRRIASDAVLGVGYAVEELDDPALAAPRRTRTPATVAVQRAVAAVPDPPEPDLDDPASDEPGVTRAQLARIAAGLRAAGITERADALAYVSGVIGRDITSRSDLTRVEAGHVIDDIEAAAPGPSSPQEQEEPSLPDPADGDDPWAGES